MEHTAEEIAQIGKSLIDDAINSLKSTMPVGYRQNDWDDIKLGVEKLREAESLNETGVPDEQIKEVKAHYLAVIGSYYYQWFTELQAAEATLDRLQQIKKLRIDGENYILESISTWDSMEARYFLGLYYCVIHYRFGDAITEFEKVIKLDPSGVSGEWGLKSSKEIARLESQGNIQNRKTGCFIATICYGDYEHPDVIILRHYRDRIKQANWIGNFVVNLYYLVSPGLAEALRGRYRITEAIRIIILKPIVRKLKQSLVDDHSLT